MKDNYEPGEKVLHRGNEYTVVRQFPSGAVTLAKPGQDMADEPFLSVAWIYLTPFDNNNA